MRGHFLMLLIGLALLAAVGYLGLGGWLFVNQDRLLLFPSANPDLSAMRAAAQGYDLVPWKPAGEYRGFVATPPGPIRATVLAFHGNGGAAGWHQHIADGLARQGFRVVLADYPGFGGRAGSAGARAAIAAANEDFSLVQKTWPGPILLVGVSFGSGIAAQLAGHHPESTCGVLLITPWDSLFALVQRRFRIYPTSLMLREKLDSGAALARYPQPIVIVAALSDEVIPVAHARHLREQLGERARWFEMPTMHNDWPQRNPAWKDWTDAFQCRSSSALPQ